MQVLDKGYVELIDVLGDEKRVVETARLSYGRVDEPQDKAIDRILNILLSNGHYSPFEHVVFTFRIKCPIYIARQWMRHRTGSYNELSRRYTKGNWEYYTPELDRLKSDKCDAKRLQKRLNGMMEFQMREYEDLIRLGVPAEVARGIMGVGFYTTFDFTMDLRNLLHFLELRHDGHAQLEIQEYANAMELLIEEKVPNIIKKWRDYQ